MFSSKDFFARMLESDKAENLGSLSGEPGITGGVIFGFSSIIVLSLVISAFSTLLLALALALLLLLSLATSTME